MHSPATMQLLERLREGVYGSGSQQVYFEDEDTYRDLTDLFTVVSQNRGTGSPNLENAQVENMARTMYEHRPLSAMEIGLLKRLLAKYASDIEQLRSSPDRDGQDYLAAPDPATARLVTGGR
jgi:hypothetical protein